MPCRASGARASCVSTGQWRNFAPSQGLKALCLMRFLNPRSEIRMAAGREFYLGAWASLVFYPANSIFVDGYLTTPGQVAQAAHQLVEAAGFEVEQEADMSTGCGVEPSRSPHAY